MTATYQATAALNALTAQAPLALKAAAARRLREAISADAKAA